MSQPGRGPITVGVLLATVMSALDTTVVNVALPHMQGNLSASSEQINLGAHVLYQWPEAMTHF